MSRAVNAIYARYTDRIEPFGIDESWLDMTQTWRLFGSSAGVADAVRRAVKAETGLTISVGVGASTRYLPSWGRIIKSPGRCDGHRHRKISGYPCGRCP